MRHSEDSLEVIVPRQPWGQLAVGAEGAHASLARRRY